MALQSTGVVLVLTTIPVELDADGFAKVLVDERLAACVSVLAPMSSVYRWQGSVETAGERQVLIKTTSEHLGALERRIGELHPYEVPEVLVVPVSGGGAAYLAWVAGEAGGREG